MTMKMHHLIPTIGAALAAASALFIGTGVASTLPPAITGLKSQAITLPEDATMFSGPQAEALNNNCLACHSASMVASQPPLKPDQWRTIVHKMRDVYKAPIADEDIEPIVTGLATGITIAKAP